MSYSDNDSYGYCKGCFKQHQFCTCQGKEEEVEHTDQTFSENNPQCQSIGEQEQEQKQEQGGLEQEQGPQIQGQNQDGQKQGPQTQEQGNQSQGPQAQNQNEIQVQNQDQDQTEDQDQNQGPQLQAQRHGDQTMTNDQSISTPVDVDGVTMDVKCGDCKPIIIIDDDFFEKQKNNKRGKRGGEGMENCNGNGCAKDCDCCVQNLAGLLKEVQAFQSTITTADEKAIDIYFSTMNGLTNPTTGQVINQVVDCSVLRFRPATQDTIAPNTAVQLCDVAGICATDTVETPDVFEFLLDKANEVESTDDDCKKKKSCTCPCCATGIGEELRCTANYGLLLDVYVKGYTPVTPLSLYVLTVKDCLVYFVDSLTDPNEICVFSSCAISGFTVVSQTIGG
ncbi:hypothetical protein LCL96_14590 [Rossellomorea aquimaris]|uniref:hypothetical protein n=1 Tax=Rossellomorea aquimaris TaxID=189382 RepID=UPI001CD3DC94|nr:hypothetical protein [Rossellomorea aquimaris]MCA1060163.1 hypothetical protein [Rossellomorea aquimaris]